MADAKKSPPVVEAATPRRRLIAVPARAREEIGELTFYLEQAVRNLREVREQIRGSSRTMPSVLHELRDIVTMTEAATGRVLDETEALVEEGCAVATLLGDVRREAGAVAGVAEPLGKAEQLVARANGRAMAIMSALEFQDVTAQKVHRAFGVLEEVVARLARIRVIIDSGQEVDPLPDLAGSPITPQDGKSGQDLADELLLRFAR